MSELSRHLTQDLQDHALSLEPLLQTLELFGVCIPPGLATKAFTLLGKGQVEFDAHALGRLHDFVPGDLQQTTRALRCGLREDRTPGAPGVRGGMNDGNRFAQPILPH